MRFPRATRLFRGHLDLAPFLCVLFPLALVALFSEYLVLPRGARIAIPAVEAPLALGAGEPVFTVAIDSAQRLYFENQVTTTELLEALLRERVKQPGAPQTLLLQADATVTYGRLSQLAALARRAGLRDVVFGTVPPPRP